MSDDTKKISKEEYEKMVKNGCHEDRDIDFDTWKNRKRECAQAFFNVLEWEFPNIRKDFSAVVVGMLNKIEEEELENFADIVFVMKEKLNKRFEHHPMEESEKKLIKMAVNLLVGVLTNASKKDELMWKE